MAKEYKFMFDRSFDDTADEDVIPAPDNDVKNPMASILNAVNNILDEEKKSPELSEVFAAKDPNAPATPKNETPPPAPTFSEKELNAAKTAAFEEGKALGLDEGMKTGHDAGFAEGLEQGKTEGHDAAAIEFADSQEKKGNELLDLIAQRLADFEKTANDARQAAFSDALKIARAVCAQVLPVFCAKHGADEIADFLSTSFAPLRDEQKVVIRLHPDTVDALKKRLPEIVSKSGFQGKIMVAKDDALSAADCFIEWKNGGIERKVEEVLQQADALLKQYEKTATPVIADDVEKGDKNG